jgi:hypothetical protein
MPEPRPSRLPDGEHRTPRREIGGHAWRLCPGLAHRRAKTRVADERPKAGLGVLRDRGRASRRVCQVLLNDELAIAVAVAPAQCIMSP